MHYYKTLGLEFKCVCVYVHVHVWKYRCFVVLAGSKVKLSGSLGVSAVDQM